MRSLYEKYSIQPFGAIPTDRQIAHLRDYNKKAFFHFGVNTFSNAEWGDGSELESSFNPTETDVRQWVRSVKEAGFTLAIITAKHHDGFCLWPSKYTEHSVKNSPYKNGKGDIIREFSDACREFEIRCGIYLSPWDRHSKYWGTEEYSTEYNNQLTELMTDYGRIDEVWWDGAGSTETPYNWGLWANTIRTLQPNAVIFGSLGATPYAECRWVGNESGFAGDPHFATIDAASLEAEDTKMLNSGKFGGDRFITAEVDVSIRPGWFYHADQDEYVKSPKQLADLWFRSVGRSALMLLNFPPDRRGLLCDADIKNAIEANKIISETFAENLALGAAVTADSLRDSVCAPEFVLQDDYDSFYAASDSNITPMIEFTMPTPVTFDTFKIGEKVEFGVRVKGFRVEAFVGGEWKILADKKSMGHLWSEHFDAVTTDRVRVVIYDTACAPIIREFGLYKLPDAYFNSELTKNGKKLADIAHGPSSKIIAQPYTVNVSFGGIYPFNTISFNGGEMKEYKIYAFDGTDYYLIHEGKDPAKREIVRLPETIDSSYQIKLDTDLWDNNMLDICVFEQ